MKEGDFCMDNIPFSNDLAWRGRSRMSTGWGREEGDGKTGDGCGVPEKWGRLKSSLVSSLLGCFFESERC
jgi:hypothetical protein